MMNINCQAYHLFVPVTLEDTKQVETAWCLASRSASLFSLAKIAVLMQSKHQCSAYSAEVQICCDRNAPPMHVDLISVWAQLHGQGVNSLLLCQPTMGGAGSKEKGDDSGKYEVWKLNLQLYR